MSKKNNLTDYSTQPKQETPTKPKTNQPTTPKTEMPEDTKIMLQAIEEISEILYATGEKIWQKYQLRNYNPQSTCPQCNQPKNPKYKLCYNCFMKTKEQKQ